MLFALCASMPSVMAQPAPGCDGSDGCIAVEVLEVVSGGGETTFTLKVTSTCNRGISFVAFELPPGVTPITPAAGAGTYTADGITWDVEYTGTNGHPGFPSIKFENPTDGDIKEGDMVTFSYTLPGEDVAGALRVVVKSGRLVNTIALDASSCGDPCVAINADIEPLGSTTVPAGGGALSFRITYTNKTTETQTFEARLVETFPDGSVLDPARGPWTITLAPGESRAIDYTFPVGAHLPPGTYFCEVVLEGDCRSGFFWTKLAPEAPRTGAATRLSSYPNPFNPAATLRFALEDAGAVRLAIYDVMGRQVALLTEGYLEAGPHEVAFDARALPSGTYFAKLEANGTVETLRVSLLR